MSRRPEYRLRAMDKTTGEKSQNIGAAWVNTNGSIAIRLDSFVVLQGGNNLVLTLFPEDSKATAFPKQKEGL